MPTSYSGSSAAPRSAADPRRETGGFDADKNRGRLARAYAERNALAVAFVRMALSAGWDAGRAVDEVHHKDWSPDWRHMLCVSLPGGELLQWHVSPEARPLLEGLPAYRGAMEGNIVTRQPNWPALLAQAAAAFAVHGAPRREGNRPTRTPPTLAVSHQKVKASFWGPRTLRVEECASLQAALAWLIRNRHVVVRDAQIEAPGEPTRFYSQVALNELALKMEGKSARAVVAASSPAPVPKPEHAAISEERVIARANAAIKLTEQSSREKGSGA